MTWFAFAFAAADESEVCGGVWQHQQTTEVENCPSSHLVRWK